jgi:hypothetical protein
MRDHPDHHDAELLLRLYELRREEKLRKARDWLATEFHADSLEDFRQRYPRASEGEVYFRMVTGYWEMAASLVDHGLMHEELFFENNGEFYFVWMRIRHLVPAAREACKNPQMLGALERVAQKYEKWMERRAPGALEAARELIKTGVQGGAARAS